MSNIRQSLMITQDQLDDLKAHFNSIDADSNGFINVSEIGEALELLGYRVPPYQVRDYIRDYDSNISEDKLNFEGFKQFLDNLQQLAWAGHVRPKCVGGVGVVRTMPTEEMCMVTPAGQMKLAFRIDHDLNHSQDFRKQVSRATNIETIHGAMDDSTHFVRREEQIAFANWISRNLMEDPDCKRYLPLNPDTRDLYEKCRDGILFCKMINKSQPDTIDERTINKTDLSVYRIHENLTLALTSAQSIGCNIVNIGADDLERGKPHLVLGLLWQIIRIGLLSDINLHEHPGLAQLLEEGERLEDFKKLSPEQILIRWVNYHLGRSGCGRTISNFSGDIKDSVAYIHLLHQIAPKEKGVSTAAEHEVDERERAERMLQEAAKIGCRSFVSPNDVVTGNSKLNLAFVANLFNTYPALERPDDLDLEDITEETREEKMYRNWMNSMGVSPYVNNLYNDLQDGIILFQLYDIIKPGVVDWTKVTQKFNKMNMLMNKIGNLNYAVELGRGPCNFSLVGIDGKDLYDGKETPTLALVWQLMRGYTLRILSQLAKEDGKQIKDSEIIQWANDTLKQAGKKTNVARFNDQKLSDGQVIIDLVDACKPGSVRYENVHDGGTDQEKLDNAKYAISMARKIGARVYALPEDIVEVNGKMVMTIFACLMVSYYQIHKPK